PLYLSGIEHKPSPLLCYEAPSQGSSSIVGESCLGDRYNGLSSPSFGSRFTANSSLKFAPTDLLALLFVMLGKDLAQEGDFWQAAHRLGRRSLIDASQQVCHILTDQLAQEVTLRFGLGKAGQFKAIDIPVKPLGVQVGLQPVWL